MIRNQSQGQKQSKLLSCIASTHFRSCMFRIFLLFRSHFLSIIAEIKRDFSAFPENDVTSREFRVIIFTSITRGDAHVFF